MNSLPWFPFYPADFLKDPGVRSLSREDRATWVDILCYMHESEEYGYLSLSGKPIPDEALARLLGLTLEEWQQTLLNLLLSGVCKQERENTLETGNLDEDKGENKGEIRGEGSPTFIRPLAGRLYCKRMVQDQKRRRQKARKCSEAGKKGGGNPAFARHKPNIYYKKPNDLYLDKGQDIGDYKREDKHPDEQIDKGEINYQKSESEREKKNSLRESKKLLRRISPNGNPGSRLPQDWQPSKEVLDFAFLECQDLDVDYEVAEFCDYWRAVPGKRGVKLDWQATFRAWLRRSQKYFNERNLSPLKEAERLLRRDEQEAARQQREADVAEGQQSDDIEQLQIF